MSTLDQAHTIRRRGLLAELLEAVDDRTVEILRRRERSTVLKRRGWLVRRALLTADVLGLLLAFAAALALDAGPTSGGELVLFALTIPALGRRREAHWASTSGTRSAPTTRRSTTSSAFST